MKDRRKGKKMDNGAMVGLMGLTFFCNKCVEVLYKFRSDKATPGELEEVCTRAVNAFKSLKWPKEPSVLSAADRAIFNTNEEIESFERVIGGESEEANETLDSLINDLQFVIKDEPLEKRKHVAEKLQRFFDILGDYSFYASRDSLRMSNNLAGV